MYKNKNPYNLSEEDLKKFRNCPIPHTSGHTNFGSFFRQPKTYNERKQYYKEPSLVRAKRNATVLWFSFDDCDRCNQKSWKKNSKKKRQHGYDSVLIRKLKRN